MDNLSTGDPVPTERLGVWLVGARGSVATTAITGWRAVLDGLAAPTGIATEALPLAAAPLPLLADLVFGGHDVAAGPDVPTLRQRAVALAEGGVLPAALPVVLREHLDAVEAEIRPGVSAPAPGAVERLRADLADFKSRHGLTSVVVVNVASTEPPAADEVVGAGADELLTLAYAGRASVPPSTLYAIAALEEGCAYVDFTPSSTTRMRGIDELALLRGLPYAGRDGKTGETLVKSALAPMFLDRALKVRSWAGANLLGGGDGATLASPENVRSKLASKGGTLTGILGEDVEAPVRIDYVADLGEWKTAWDHITFEGFLGTRMRMQFTWDGCDSALAAPLILDLARLAGAALAAGEAGALDALGWYFKDPVGSTEYRLAAQFTALCDWALALPAPVRTAAAQERARS